jgi:NADH dehydrogenase
MQDRKILLLGGSGFVGRHLAVELAQRGARVTLPCRRPQRLNALRVLSTLQLVEANITDPGQLAALCQGQDVVINLLGILNQSSRLTFRNLHIEFVKTVLETCRLQKVDRLLHISALGADQANGASEYLRSKGEGENLVHTFGRKDLNVTSFQPSVIFGEDDSFINRFVPLIRMTPGVLPLACAQSRFSPVYIGDVVRRIADAVDDPAAIGQRYPLCGPETLTLGQIVEAIAAALGQRCQVIGLPDSLARLQAGILQNLPGKLFTMDNYRSLQVASTCSQPSPGCDRSFSVFLRGLSSHFDRRAEYDKYRRQLD